MRAPAWMNLSCGRKDRVGNREEILTYFARFCIATNCDKLSEGIYRDPVRSSHAHLVKASGLRWLALMLLVPLPWTQRVWALPFLTCLCPSQRYDEQRGRAHRTLTDRARQMVWLVARWLPGRDLV